MTTDVWRSVYADGFKGKKGWDGDWGVGWSDAKNFCGMRECLVVATNKKIRVYDQATLSILSETPQVCIDTA